MKTLTTWTGDLSFESMQEELGPLVMDGNLKKGLSPKALLLAIRFFTDLTRKR